MLSWPVVEIPASRLVSEPASRYFEHSVCLHGQVAGLNITESSYIDSISVIVLFCEIAMPGLNRLSRIVFHSGGDELLMAVTAATIEPGLAAVASQEILWAILNWIGSK